MAAPLARAAADGVMHGAAAQGRIHALGPTLSAQVLPWSRSGSRRRTGSRCGSCCAGARCRRWDRFSPVRLAGRAPAAGVARDGAGAQCGQGTRAASDYG